MHLVTTARIQVLSSVGPFVPEPVGGWKATFRPSWSGNCNANASLRAFGSREKGMFEPGPTELRAGNVIFWILFTPGVAGVEVTAGD